VAISWGSRNENGGSYLECPVEVAVRTRGGEDLTEREGQLIRALARSANRLSHSLETRREFRYCEGGGKRFFPIRGGDNKGGDHGMRERGRIAKEKD